MHILLDRHSRSLFIHFNLIISLLSQNSVTSSLQDFPFIHILRQQTAQDIERHSSRPARRVSMSHAGPDDAVGNQEDREGATAAANKGGGGLGK